MGYRHYFHSVPKTEIAEIKQCKTNEEFCSWAKSKDYSRDDEFVSVYNIGKELYELGKYVDWAFEMQENNESIFGDKGLEEMYSDYCPVICTQEDFLIAINKYKENVVKYYKGLLDESKHTKLPIVERWKTT